MWDAGPVGLCHTPGNKPPQLGDSVSSLQMRQSWPRAHHTAGFQQGSLFRDVQIRTEGRGTDETQTGPNPPSTPRDSPAGFCTEQTWAPRSSLPRACGVPWEITPLLCSSLKKCPWFVCPFYPGGKVKTMHCEGRHMDNSGLVHELLQI